MSLLKLLVLKLPEHVLYMVNSPTGRLIGNIKEA